MIEYGHLHIGQFFFEIELVFLLALVLLAAIFDIRFRRIPNFLIALGLAISFLYANLSSYGIGFQSWIAGLFVGFAIFIPLYVIRAMGAGDVKLIATVGSFVGGIAAFKIVGLTLISGGALALVVMLYTGRWKLAFENIGLITANMTIAAMTRQTPKAEIPIKSAGNLPYGTAIAAGTLLYLCFFHT